MLQALATGLGRRVQGGGLCIILQQQQQQQQARLYSTGPKHDYSLVMKQAMEVSTESASPPLPPGEAGITFGVPFETFKRKAIVTSLSRVAGQQGLGNTLENAAAPAWRIEFDAEAKWQNPLQGWNSTADPLENVGRSSLFFFTKEQAVAYATKAGWEVEVIEPALRRKDRQKRYLSYGDNFTVKRKGMPDLSHLAAYGKMSAGSGRGKQ